MIFDEFLTFNLKISTLNNLFRVKQDNIGDLLDFDLLGWHLCSSL